MQHQDLASERVVLSAPLSFSGSARRIWKITRTSDSHAVNGLFVVPALLLIALAWTLVLAWYVLCLPFLLLLVAFRLFRRGSRKERAARLRHQEALAEIRSAQSSTKTTSIATGGSKQ